MADRILTGEGVALEVDAASVLSRAAAWLVDAAVTAGLLIVVPLVVMNLIGFGSLDDALAQAVVTALVALVFLVIPVTVETLTHGRSLGKWALGLQVIRDDGGPVRLRHAGVRGLLGVFELWLLAGGLAFVTSMLNDRGKRVGDYLAGTYVVRMRSPKSTVPPLYLPLELAEWVRLTDLRPLPDGLALRARQFLARANSFPPQLRHRLGLRLAAQLELFVAPAPPPSTPQEAFIAAVLHERRRREHEAFQRSRPRLDAQLVGIDTLPYGVADPLS